MEHSRLKLFFCGIRYNISPVLQCLELCKILSYTWQAHTFEFSVRKAETQLVQRSKHNMSASIVTIMGGAGGNQLTMLLP